MQTAKFCDKQFTQPVEVPPLRGKEDFSATWRTNLDSVIGNALEACKDTQQLTTQEETIKSLVLIGHACAVDTAIYLSDARENYFKRTMDWMVWACELTDYEPRYLYTLLGVGDMMRELGEVYYLKHKSTDIVRLEIAATIDDKKKKCVFLNDADFLTLTRDELRAKAAQLKGIKAREEHAEKVAKKGIQLDFFGMLGGVAAQSFASEAEVMGASAKISPDTLIKSGTNVLMMVEAAADMGRLANVPQAVRESLAQAMRDAAVKLETAGMTGGSNHGTLSL